MALFVQKYGGTSVGSTERIKNVARRVAKFYAQGHELVVVVSAMSGETNRLITLAKEIQTNPDPRELDVMVSTGEQVTVALLAMALKELNIKAKSYTGAQVRILTDNAYTKARILKIDEDRIRSDLKAGNIVVVAIDVEELEQMFALGVGPLQRNESRHIAGQGSDRQVHLEFSSRHVLVVVAQVHRLHGRCLAA